MVKVDEEIDAAQERRRIDGAELERAPVRRPVADEAGSSG
jgi:hypothetical protein